MTRPDTIGSREVDFVASPQSSNFQIEVLLKKDTKSAFQKVRFQPLGALFEICLKLSSQVGAKKARSQGKS